MLLPSNISLYKIITHSSQKGTAKNLKSTMTFTTAPGNQQPQTNVQINSFVEKKELQKNLNSTMTFTTGPENQQPQTNVRICLFLLVSHGRNIILKDIFFG